MDDKSSYNIPYSDTMDLKGYWKEDLSPYGRGNLLALNDLITRPQGVMDLEVTIGEVDNERKVILNFLIILCRSTFKCILGRSFLARLDAVSSPVHLKAPYHNEK